MTEYNTNTKAILSVKVLYKWIFSRFCLSDLQYSLTDLWYDVFLLQMPPQANNTQVGLNPGDTLSLHDSDEHNSKMAAKSVIKTTQEDHLKRMTVVVRFIPPPWIGLMP